ncbi:MAG: hypothetical protein K9L17_12565 [Clostridiales bacterium]|nr:hypothetical protein [Clostridiales bacterium]MCF8023515.1 hypothetical protein [Clostridiales bacterium]
MSAPGEVKNRHQEFGLILVRCIVVVFTFLVVSGVGILVNIPPGIAGILAGLVGFGLIVGALFDVVHVSCPRCGYNANLLRNTGSFKCPECSYDMYIYDGNIKPADINEKQVTWQS